ncbi:MAG: tRNA-binding protein [Armatimonadota bacterium]
MSAEVKPIVSIEVFEQLDIRIGRILEISRVADAPKPSYVVKADFGKYGIRTSVGRFTSHSEEHLIGKMIFGVLNFEPREIGGIWSEFLTLGVQIPKMDSGEATLITPLNPDVKVGSKLF